VKLRKRCVASDMVRAIRRAAATYHGGRDLRAPAATQCNAPASEKGRGAKPGVGFVLRRLLTGLGGPARPGRATGGRADEERRSSGCVAVGEHG
jgi:hypothetical protein